MKKRIIACILALCLLAALMPAVLAAGSFEMPEIGFRVQMNPRSGNEKNIACSSGETLDVDLAKFTSAYIRPDIEGVESPSQTPWGQHTYYTFEFQNIVNNVGNNENLPFGNEKVYNRTNTGNTGNTSKIVVDDYDDERLEENNSYYKLIVKAYQSDSWGGQNPEKDVCLGTAESILHVRMTWNVVLDWLASYWWDECEYGETYEIKKNLETIYETPEALIEGHLAEYQKTDGYDKNEDNILKNIPVAWELKEGTAYSTQPGASNTFTWTAKPKEAVDGDKWTVPEGFSLSGDITFKNPGELVNSYTITASAGEGGSISPEGNVVVLEGTDKTFNITPDSGYVVENVLVDGNNVGAVGSYTFDNVKADHTISATFKRKPTIILPPIFSGVGSILNMGDHSVYLDGYPDGTFGPERNMTRAEVAQMFYNLLLDKDVRTTVRFTDVAADAWYAPAVHALASLGIVDGVGNGKFAPERAITRAEFTVIAMRFTEQRTGGGNPFSDVNRSQWFYDQVVGAVEHGWITGYPDGTFRPNETIKRSEVTAIVNRMLERAADEAYVDRHLYELRTFPDVAEAHWAFYEIMEATNEHTYTKGVRTETWTSTAKAK